MIISHTSQSKINTNQYLYMQSKLLQMLVFLFDNIFKTTIVCTAIVLILLRFNILFTAFALRENPNIFFLNSDVMVTLL
ncbi:MAG TPA: hypothetical protein DCS35_15850 [Vibrio sp.]|nr:hypothetical protein [Vibrio sp.]